MPWLQKAMKDAAKQRYASGRCLATFDPEISEWGNPVKLDLIVLRIKCLSSRTQGSKTFQYLKEKKLISIPRVAASENG